MVRLAGGSACSLDSVFDPKGVTSRQMYSIPCHGQMVENFRNQMHARKVSEYWEESDIKNRVQLIRKLGSGTYGTCYSGKYKGESVPVAVKVCASNHLHKSVSPTEISCLLRVQGHPNVITLRDYFCSPFYVVLAMQMLQIDLYRLLTECTVVGGLQPDVAIYVTMMMAKGIARLHECSILY